MCKEKNSAFIDSIDRRKLLMTLGKLGASMMIVSCGGPVSTTGNSAATGSDDSNDGATGGGTNCIATPTETNGPFPADGSNSAGDGSSTRLDDVYVGSPIIRKNITSNADGSSTIAGVPLNLTFTLQNTNNSCAVLSGYYIYIWHCTPGGQYSAYNGSGNGSHSRTETYLRGIQGTDASGQASFTTVYPGWYPGRAIHIHVEIYQGLSSAPIQITQVAFPMDVNNAVQASSGYNGVSGITSNSSDGIFSDGISTQMLAVTGSVSAGYNANIILRVAA